MGQPRTFGERYELGELIGYGGMAEVHRGRDIRLGREVAIKVLRSDLARDPSFQTRFRREAQAAARLNHPAIVAVYDTGEDIGPSGAVPYIVMEFIEGRTLRDILRAEGHLQPTRAMEIAAEISSALDYSHRAGIVHRDIKPANVMITRAGSVKVMDFGIARAVADDAATVTQTAAVIGTAQYLSPEQARGEPVDARSDVYSCGCLLYELVAGRPPFVGDSPVAVAYQHVREVPPLPSTLNADIPRALDSVTMKALAKNPQNRYQSAGEMGADLSRILADQPVQAETALTDEERTQFIARPSTAGVAAIGFEAGDHDDGRGGRRGAVVWASVVAALLVVIVGVSYLVLRNTDDAPVQVAVPLIVGRTPDQADNALRQAGLQPAGNPQVSNGPCGDGGSSFPNVAEGSVCTQEFQNGTRRQTDTTVAYTVFEQGTVTVPQVVGLSYTDAQGQLTSDGFMVAAPQYVNNGQPAGTVVGQNPQAATSVTPGATITLQVSNGRIPIPGNLVGMSPDDALRTLRTAGFTGEVGQTTQAVTDPAQDGLVVGSDPTGGTNVDPSITVTLTVGEYTAPPSSPVPTCTTAGSTPTGTPSPGETALPVCDTQTTDTPSSPSGGSGGGGGGGGGGGRNR